MDRLVRGMQTLGRRARQALALVAAVIVLLVIAYRFVLPFTPPWLDLAAMGSGGLALVVLWAVGRGRTFDYSAPIERHGNAHGDEREV